MSDIFEQLKRIGAKPQVPDARRAQPPETLEDYFAQIPPEIRPVIEEMSRGNHRHFQDRFPKYEEFRNAMSRAWLEKRRGFEEEMQRLGFTAIEKGTKASELNGSALAYFTQAGSVFFLGPGAFEGKNVSAPGAAYSYKRISYRKNPELMDEGEQQNGVFVRETPKVGELLRLRMIVQVDRGERHATSPSSTHPIMVGMKKETGVSSGIAVVRQASADIATRFQRVDEETGLSLVRPKK